jgi:hypothetical protein
VFPVGFKVEQVVQDIAAGGSATERSERQPCFGKHRQLKPVIQEHWNEHQEVLDPLMHA